MIQPLTSDMVARAIVAAAVALGDDPVVAVTSAKAKGSLLRRSLIPAVRAVAEVTGCKKGRLCATLGVDPTALSKVGRQSPEAYAAALAALSGEAPVAALKITPLETPLVPAKRHDHTDMIRAALARRPRPSAPVLPAEKAMVTCSWPMGDPVAPDFRQCGEEVVATRRYCASHCVAAGIKPVPKPLATVGRVAMPYSSRSDA